VERESGEQEKLKLLLPCLYIRREEEHAQCCLKRHRVLFFFLRKWNVIRKNPKMGYNSIYEMKELEN
jgi:hypothetical protein